MAKLKGLNIIEKCSALDDLLDDLEDAQEQIICAKDEISEEYANVFKKKFHLALNFASLSRNDGVKIERPTE